MLASCKQEREWRAARTEAPANPAGAALVTRPDSAGVLYLSEPRALVAFSSRGVELWRARLEESLLGAPAVADDSSIFARTERKLVAFQPDGKLAWSRELPRPALAAWMLGPSPLRDSGVAVVTAADRIEVFLRDGTPRCALQLPMGRRLRLAPRVAANGTILIAADDALLAYGDDCNQRWERPVLQPKRGR
jgi:hypothetical protein